ncbi:MAG: hypothetical protein R3F34_09370 [Planctomycetota bacterium]
MRGLLYLTLRYLRRRPVPSALLAACLAVAVLLPAVTHLLTSGFERSLLDRARSTPLVVGAEGPPLDLVLSGLYFSHTGDDTITTGVWHRIAERDDLLAVPLDVRFTARRNPIVATSPEYFEQRGLVAVRGRVPYVAGEVALGADVAADLGLGPGDTLFSDPVDSLDLSAPPSIKMHVVGVLGRARTADDRAVFVTLETAFALSGVAHGHGDVSVESVDPKLVIGADSEEVRLSPAYVTYNELTPENLATFHLHTDPEAIPISCVLVFPRTPKARTMLLAEGNIEHVFGAVQVVDSEDEFGRLLELVLGLKRLLDAVAIVLLVATVALGALVLGLSMKLRETEIHTLDRLGSSARTVALLHTFQIGFVALAALGAAAVVVLAVLLLDPDLTVFL